MDLKSSNRMSKLRLPLLCAALLITAACGNTVSTSTKNGPVPSFQSAQPQLLAAAISDAKYKQAKGQRVWCVPFARAASGVEIQGNGGTWWNSAAGRYERNHQPRAGAVMAFASMAKMPMGHVAVVAEVVDSRKVLINHTNWHRNKISLKMPVIDISPKNDWSMVRVEGTPGVLGSPYKVQGFIHPTKQM